ncbi:MAG: hypothetical protein K9M13_01110 [Simkaniaceae bacterium]|nr:hypothetical protein [Simkaniaceae bacterium]
MINNLVAKKDDNTTSHIYNDVNSSVVGDVDNGSYHNPYNNGMSFSGPIQLSGLALAKQYLLEVQDNYMGFMSAMLSLFSEDCEVFSKVTESQANSAKNEILDGALGQFTSGLTNIASGAYSQFTISRGYAEDAPINGKIDALDTDVNNMSDLQSEVVNARKGTTLDSEGVELMEVGVAGPDLTEHEQTLENFHNADEATIKKYMDKTSAESQGLVEAVKVLKKESIRDPARREAIEEKLNKLHTSMKTHISERKAEREALHTAASTKSTHRQSHLSMMKSFADAGSSIAQSSSQMAQSIEKETNTYAAATAQMNQQVLSTTEGVAQKAAQSADEINNQIRQIQSYNQSRG